MREIIYICFLYALKTSPSKLISPMAFPTCPPSPFPHTHTHTLKNEGPPLKSEVPFQCVKKFIFSKFTSCRLVAVNFTTKWTPSKVFFCSILSLSMLSPCIDSRWPIKFWKGGGGGRGAQPPCSQHLWETLGMALAFSTDFLYMSSIKCYLLNPYQLPKFLIRPNFLTSKVCF